MLLNIEGAFVLPELVSAVYIDSAVDDSTVIVLVSQPGGDPIGVPVQCEDRGDAASQLERIGNAIAEAQYDLSMDLDRLLEGDEPSDEELDVIEAEDAEEGFEPKVVG